MKKDRIKGFVAGLLSATLVFGLVGTGLAVARTRTIQVSDGIAVTVNGVPFTPRDVNGKEVSLFAYEGTTYAPVRAFAQAAGLLVDYDAATGTARVETPDYAAQTDPAAGSYIGVDKAKELALADAGVNADSALFLKANLDWEDDLDNGSKAVKAIYEVEFCAQQSEYDYDIDAVTGAVLNKELDLPDFDWSRHDDYRIGRHGESDDSESDDAAAPDGLLSAQEAEAKALERLPGGTAVKCELDYQDDWGRWVYELELRLGQQEYDCEIDAATGEIVKWELDD